VLQELWAHRDLGRILAWRELVVRYKRSALGIVWALGEPLVLVVVYTAVFGYILGARTGLDSYVLFALFGVLPWTFFASTLEQSAIVLLEHAPIIKKAYFPRELLTLSVVLSRLTTLGLGLALGLIAAVLFADLDPSRLWALPVGVVVLAALTSGLGAVLGALQVLLRDVQFLTRFALRLLFFACPVVYPVARVPAEARPLYDLNPMVAVLWFFQTAVEPTVPMPSTRAWLSLAVVLILIPIGGWVLFRRLQWRVADLL
jgi:ABC-type polysaccharide/polyol phosphate export permease